MTRLPLDVCPVSTPRHPGAALSVFSTLGKPPGEPWARAAPAHAQNSVRATAAAINRLRPLETFMARCPPSGRGSPTPSTLALEIRRAVDIGDGGAAARNGREPFARCPRVCRIPRQRRRLLTTWSGGLFMVAFRSLVGLLVSLALVTPAAAQELPKVTVAMSGWTGCAPLSLAEKSGIFKQHGVDVTIKFIPQKDRHLAIASGDVQCAATTVETWIVWHANGVATKQVVQLDRSYGADGMVVRSGLSKIADLKGKTVAASAPGTAPYFTLAWMLKKNGLGVKDVRVATLEPAAAAQAFIAGQNDAAMTYEPYLSTVREKPEAGKIIATTLDYPMVMDTFGCTPKFIAENNTAVKALVKSYYDALELIKTDQKKAYDIMVA